MDANRQPGDAEAAGAAAGMQEVYGRRLEHAVGDTVTFQIEGWDSPRQGKVDAIDDDTGNYLIFSESRIYLVWPDEIRRV